MEYGSGQKYCVKWSNLSEEHISEYGCNHRLFQDPAKERPPKAPKMHGPHCPRQYLSTQKDLAFPYLTWPMHQNFIRLLPKIQSQNT